MTPPRVSVIALTRDRPKEFLSLLQALEQQRMRDFEVIVVGAEADIRLHGATDAFIDRVAYVQCADQNISKSRNIGIGQARGEILAFIDDDAAPEPDWLTELTKPFETANVAAVGGFVRGRNGVDFQWRGALIDRYGDHASLTLNDMKDAGFNDPNGELFLSTVGVNSAFRAKALRQIGGFDENFHYFLDESDVCLRLVKAGWGAAIAPFAEVHHAYAESRERAANRAPRDLYQVSASRVYYSLTHGDPDWVERKIDRFQQEQSDRLKKFIQLGRLSRRQAEWMQTRMTDGMAEGRKRFAGGARRGVSLTPAPAAAPKPFVDFALARRPRAALIATSLNRRRIYKMADRLARSGCETTVMDFEVSAKRLRVSFAAGFWRHVGGILGREHIGARPPVPRRCIRVRREMERVAARRDFDVVLRPKASKFRTGDLSPTPIDSIIRGYVAEPLRPGAAAQIVTLIAGLGAASD